MAMGTGCGNRLGKLAKMIGEKNEKDRLQKRVKTSL